MNALAGAPSTGRRRWKLKTRLLALLLALLAVVCLVVGTVTVLALRGFLVDQVDKQLASADRRSQGSGGPPPGVVGGGSVPAPEFLFPRGQASGTVSVFLRSGATEAAGRLDDRGRPQRLAGATAAELAAIRPGGGPRTVELSGLGSYRVLAAQTPEGDVFVTGLPLAGVDTTVASVIVIELVVAGVAVLIAVAVGVYTMRRTMRPLDRVVATAHRVSTLPLARGEVEIHERIDEDDVDERTEVGQVAGAVNRLLDHVDAALTARQASETKVRQFVADASHELRTPLSTIRGYAELTRRDRADAPPRLARAMERVESEAQRMTAMVEDLLLLARLDAGRELSSEPVDLTHLMLDAVSDANATGRGHEWRLKLPDEPVLVVGDQASLQQVVANLLTNARVHTPDGTTVTASLSTGAWQAVLTILDDGPGIDPEVLPTVFERFARGESSRSRAAGSTGLGLAIVKAIVEAHGGTIQVTSRRGQTAFVVRLPSRA